MDQLASRRTSPRPIRLEFFVRDNDGTERSPKRILAQLSANSSLSPLFHAFGLISDYELERTGPSTSQDVQLLRWLSLTVQEAVTTAERHEQLKLRIRKLKADIEATFCLASVQAGSEYSASILDQERQMESITVLDQTLKSLTSHSGEHPYAATLVIIETNPQLHTASGVPFIKLQDLEGCQFRLYHPNDPDTVKESSSQMENGSLQLTTHYAPPYIDPSGCIHVVTVKSDIQKHLAGLDYYRARTLSQVSYYWVRRMRQLSEPLADLLRVRSVWCEQSMSGAVDLNEGNQKFVVWAGYVLEKRAEIEAALEGRRFSFSMIVNPAAESSELPLTFHPSSPILYVSTDCQVNDLVQFLSSEAGGTASLQARDAHEQRAMEEIVLEEVRVALGAKCVIKICMAEGVMEGARRLRDNAELIRHELGVDLLKGACIAIDDCYEVWDSGFISIPWNFRADELPGMVRMLQAGQAPGVNVTATTTTSIIRCLPACNLKGGHGHLRTNPIPQRPLLPSTKVVRRPMGRTMCLNLKRV